jgi:dual specificity phosphatase 12
LHSLSAALSEQHRLSIGVTHILSVCPDYPSTGDNHLAIPVQDSEYEDLLVHLPRACRFIESALAGGGRVLVHCVMGISRSATVVAAYRKQHPKNTRPRER